MPQRRRTPSLNVEQLEPRLNLAPVISCPVDDTADVLNSFERPIEGSVAVTSGQGPRVLQVGGKWIIQSLHRGVDLGVATGTPVESVAPGRVVAAKFHKDLGNYVVIQHANDPTGPIYTWYQHLDRIDVEPNQCVDNDTQIGTVGSTGRSSGPHLHMNVGRTAKISDRPSDWINPRETSAFTAEEKNRMLQLEQREQGEYEQWQRGVQFNGAYTGSYSGTVTAFGITRSISGSVRFTVLNGVITVTVPSSGSGKISGSNPLAKFASGGVAGPGVPCKFGGGFNYVDAATSDGIAANGSWLCKFPGGVASGTWNATRS